MTYTPDPTNPAQPDPAVVAAGTAGIEFQALKGYIKKNLSNGDLRNMLINGAMNIDQFNGGAPYILGPGGAGFCIDQWLILNPGAGTITAQQVPDGPYTYKNALQWEHDGSSPASYLVQYIESIFCINLVNTPTLTVSGWIWVNDISGVVIVPSLQGPNARDTYTAGETTTPGVGVPITGLTNDTWVYFEQEITFTASQSIEGLGFVLGCTGVSGKTIKVSDLQLELNTFASPFEMLDPQIDLSLCQRYYYVFGASQQSYTPAAGNTIYQSYNLPVNYRSGITPAVSVSHQEYSSNSAGASASLFAVNETQVVIVGAESTGAGMCGFSCLVTVDSRIS